MLSEQRPFARFAVWLSAFCLFCASPAAAQNGSPVSRREWPSCVWSPNPARVLEQNPSELTIQPGQPYSREAESASLRELFRSGSYADLRAELMDVPGGVRLDYVVTQNFFINRVRIEGLREPPGEALALSALRLNVGETFRESDMKDAMDRLRQTLEDDGQYQAKIDYETTPHPDTLQMDILVRVTPGPRARIGTVTIQTKLNFATKNFASASNLRKGPRPLPTT